ncbi:hypothetical protein [Vibrio phage vB_pir03]|nr:hypothetical protein [Vibrio phage vB_pir03]
MLVKLDYDIVSSFTKMKLHIMRFYYIISTRCNYQQIHIFYQRYK